MTKNSRLSRAGALGALLLASSALTVPALAQQLPRFNQVDANGVDLVTGQFSFSLLEGSIGSGPGELALMRNWAGGGWTDNWTGTVRSDYTGGPGMVVEFGTYVDRFEMSVGWPILFTATKADGATLELLTDGTYRYRSRDGTRIVFSGIDVAYAAEYNGPVCASIGGSGCAIPILIQRPDGMTYTVNWDIERRSQDGGWIDYIRFRGVSNSANYSFTVTYATNTPGSGPPVANWYVPTGAQFTNLDGAPASLPTVTYSPVSSTVLDVTDIAGDTWRLTTAASAIGIRRPGSSTDDVSATLSGGLVTQVVRDGIATGYSRSVSGSTVTTTVTQIDGDSGTTDPQTVVVGDSDVGRITSVTDPLSRQTGFQYDGSGRVTRITRPEANSLGYTYDARGNVTEVRMREKDDTSDTGDDIVTTASYDSTCANVVTCNQPNSVTDARGNTTNFTYDSTHGGLLTATAPAPSGSGDRPQTRYSYAQVTAVTGQPVYLPTEVSACASGTSPTCVGTANEARTVTAYDTDNLRVTSVTRRNGDNSLSAANAFTYDQIGNRLTVDGPLSGTADTTRYRYDSGRRVIGAIGPDPDAGGALHHRAQRITYVNGRPTKQERGTVNSQSDGDWASFSSLEEVQQAYDSHARPTVQRLVSGGTAYALTQTSYDLLGREQCVAQRMNPSEFASLPSDACTLDTQGSHGPDRIIRTSYDAAGQVTKVETGYGVSGVAADEIRTSYTANGNAETVTDANGNMTTYHYSLHDRVDYRVMPNPTVTGHSNWADYEFYVYDANGNPTYRILRDGQVVGFTHDTLNRLTARDLPGSEPDGSFTYDLLNRMTGASHSGHALTFTYDALGRNLTQAGPLGTASYQYDAAGRRTRLTYPGSGLYVDYDYLVSGEIAAIRENGATSGAGLLGTYAYDDRGRRTSLTRGNGAVTSYAYDTVSRLTQLAENVSGSSYDTTSDFTSNPANQIAATTRSNDNYAWTAHYAVNRNYTANGRNQYSAAGAITPTYDARGNLTSAGSITYAYNSDNGLISATGSVALTYDPLRRLATTTGNTAFTRFAYDGIAMIAEYDSGSSLARRYVYGPGLEPLVWYEGTGTSDRRWLHADERGSIVAITNGSAVVTNVNTYDEYGIPGSGNAGRFQYTGQMWLGELGMYHYRARLYSPTLGRFMQTDPIGYRGGMNLYAYVGNNPVNFTDPTGLQCDGCQIMVTATLPGSSGGFIGGGSEAKFFLDAPLEDGGDGGAYAAAQPRRETRACKALRENAEAGRGSAPGYAGANWDRVNDMIYFRELYGQTAEELGAFGNGPLMWALGLAAGAAGGTFVGGALGGAMVWGNEMRSQSQRRYEAARDRVQYLEICRG